MKKNILSVLALTLLLSVSATALNAARNDNSAKNKAATEKTEGEKNVVSVKYLGTSKDAGIVFDVKYANPDGEKFDLVITNSQGDKLYQNSFSGANFNRKVLIQKDPDANGYVNFYLKSRNSDESYSKSYYIGTESSYVQNVVVKSM